MKAGFRRSTGLGEMFSSCSCMHRSADRSAGGERRRPDLAGTRGGFSRCRGARCRRARIAAGAFFGAGSARTDDERRRACRVDRRYRAARYRRKQSRARCGRTHAALGARFPSRLETRAHDRRSRGIATGAPRASRGGAVVPAARHDNIDGGVSKFRPSPAFFQLLLFRRTALPSRAGS